MKSFIDTITVAASLAAVGLHSACASGVRGKHHASEETSKMEAEDVVFWSRMMQQAGSLPGELHACSLL